MWWGYGAIMSGCIAVLFISLKLEGVIDWSWWWVLSPIYAPWLLIVSILMTIGGVYLVLGLFINVLKKKKHE